MSVEIGDGRLGNRDKREPRYLYLELGVNGVFREGSVDSKQERMPPSGGDS